MTKQASTAGKKKGPPTEFGKRLARLRAAVEPPLSAKELDRLAGLRPGHSLHLESHDKDHVEALTVLKLADVFSVTMDFLFAGRGRFPAANDVIAAVRPKRAKAKAAG